MINRADGQLIVCGGDGGSGRLRDCEFFRKGLSTWTVANYTLELEKIWFPTVQLDNERIWIGRKLFK